ncbi:MAG: TIGR00730 family Rossman fold protein [Nitrospiraceae bacterium]
MLKADVIQAEQAIRSTIVVFGSARLLEPELAQARLATAEMELRAHPDDPARQVAVRRATRGVALSVHYNHAREFAQLVSSTCQVNGDCEFVIVTGGGPGIMEAANRGAHDVGAKSMGFNITLPHEQHPNPYITPELSFQFQYFAIRKFHFMLRARALVAFPGGFGTLDELFEVLTLVQTGKSQKPTIVLFGRAFWESLIDWDLLVEAGLISPEDLDLIHYAESAEEAWNIIFTDQQQKSIAT